MHCIFCDIVAGTVPASIVYQDETVLAFLDIRPFSSGHCIVAPKQHFTYLRELDEKTGAALFTATQRIEPALATSGVPWEGTNLYMADRRAGGQDVFHVHLHVFPRHGDDGIKINPDQSRSPSRADLDATAAQIRAQLAAGVQPGLEQYWVVGGEYTDTTFKTAVGGVEQRIGPFPTVDGARRAWVSLSQKSVDDAHVRFHIERAGSAVYWVVGGTYVDTEFQRTAGDAPEERLGPFDSYDAAFEAWRAKAWATADDGHVRYRIEQD